MEIIANTTDFYLARGKETAAAMGKFDGVHIGHRRLLEEILSQKKRGAAACVFTFDPPPAVLFGRRGEDVSVLSTKEEKRLLFERMGVDILIEFPLNQETAAMSPEAFALEVLAERMNVAFLAAGSDLSFGAKGAGDAALLQRLGPKLGFETRIIDKVCLRGIQVSSTLVRERLERGDMEEVLQLLGMPYMIAGKVVEGKRIGRTLGFPTVNLLPRPEKKLPPRGVYFSQVRVRGKVYPAISNVGCKPTVTDEAVMGVESYLYGFGESAYGEDIEVFLYSFRRPEKRFKDREALRAQLQEDIAAGESRYGGILSKAEGKSRIF